MSYSNEAKVGVAIVLAALVAFFGIRYLSGLSVFGSGYQLVAVFDDTEGLTSGNTVELSGVQIGTVTSVELLPSGRAAEAILTITNPVDLPRGSAAKVSGFSALGDVGISITPGPAGVPPLTDGDTLVTATSSDLLGLVQNNAERLFGSVDTLVTGAAGTFATVDDLLANPNSDLRATLAALRQTAEGTNALLASQREQIAATLAGLRTASEGVSELTLSANTFADENADSLAATIQNLNRTLATVDRNLAAFESTSAELDAVLTKLNAGEGTLGRMLNDPALYENLNAAVTNLNALVTEFQENPKRYLQELRLVDVF